MGLLPGQGTEHPMDSHSMAPSLALETAGLYLDKSLTLTFQVSGLQPLHDSSFPKAKRQKTQPTNQQQNCNNNVKMTIENRDGNGEPVS